MTTQSAGRHLSFPFRIGADGRTVAPETLEQHVKEEIIQLLLTNPGERPFLQSFGGGLRRLVFERNDDVAAGITKALISQAMARWLGHRVTVEQLEVTAEDAKLTVDLRYRLTEGGELKQMRFERGNV